MRTRFQPRTCSSARRASVATLALLLPLASCTFHYTGELPQPTAWQRVEEPTGRGRLELAEVHFEATSLRSGVLTGKIKRAALEAHAFEARNEPEIHTKSFFIFHQERLRSRQATRNHERVIHELSIDQLRIDNPFGPGAIASVDDNGAFAATLQFDPPHVAIPPEKTDLARSLFVYVSPPAEVSVKPEAVNAPHFQPAIVRLPIWRYELDRDKAEAFARKQTTTVQLRTLDMHSRTPVPSRIRITGVSAPTRAELQQRLARAFHSESTASAMMRFIPEYLAADARLEGDAGALTFTAAAGASYRVETIHPDYLYFDQIISPINSPKERKIILLPEKGAKLRVERVDDSLGGMLQPQRP